jgi:hypothetical protein
MDDQHTVGTPNLPEPAQKLFVGTPGLLTPSKPAPREIGELASRMVEAESGILSLGQRLNDLALLVRDHENRMALIERPAVSEMRVQAIVDERAAEASKP